MAKKKDIRMVIHLACTECSERNYTSMKNRRNDPQRLEMTLVPALQSYWLKIHVTMTIIGEAVFALAFVMGFLYLVKNCRWEEIGQEVKKSSANILLLSLGLGVAVL